MDVFGEASFFTTGGTLLVTAGAVVLSPTDVISLCVTIESSLVMTDDGMSLCIYGEPSVVMVGHRADVMPDDALCFLPEEPSPLPEEPSALLCEIVIL